MRYTRAQIVDGTGFEPGALFEQVEDYNGWTNRETWAVALWINNEQGWQESTHEMVREYADAKREIGEEPLPWGAGDVVRENVETLLLSDDLGDDAETLKWQRTVLSDIGSLYRVNWDEIGASFLSDIAEG